MPEPSPVARPSLVSSFTTLGTTLAATFSTEPGSTRAGGAPLSAVVMVLVRECEEATVNAVAPPTAAEITETTTAPANSSPARERSDGVGGGSCGRWYCGAVRQS